MEEEDRRKNDDLVISLVRQIRDDLTTMRGDITTISRDLTAHRNDLATHIMDEPNMFARAITVAMERAFPAGDPDGHRKAHEASIQAYEARAEFWKKMAFEITKYGLFGLLGWLTYVIWTAFLQGPQK